jgi:hypothetical protein
MCATSRTRSVSPSTEIWLSRFLVLVATLSLPARPAGANGAFPDSQAVLTPADLPHEILLATNFGLVRSTDDGRTWTWSCEQDPSGSRSLYQLGAPPGRRLYAREAGGLVFTDDGGCTWTRAGGAAADYIVSDAFPDPTNAARVLAVAAPPGGTQGGYRLLASADAGTTFDDVLYEASPGDMISGVEISRSDAGVVYIMVLSGAANQPLLVRSSDAGVTWSTRDLSPALGSAIVLIVAVAAEDPERVFLRVNGAGANTLAVVDWGGASVKTPLALEGGSLSGFVEMKSGTILVSGMVGADPVLYRSSDGGATFQDVPSPPRLWGLSEREGQVFGAARTAEPFAIATSIDEGTTWQPLVRYADIQGVDACVQKQCLDSCLLQASRDLWSADICSPAPPPDVAIDASAEPRDATAAGPDRDQRPSSGCGCSVTEEGQTVKPALLLLAAWLLRRRRRPGLRRAGRGAPPRGDP